QRRVRPARHFYRLVCTCDRCSTESDDDGAQSQPRHTHCRDPSIVTNGGGPAYVGCPGGVPSRKRRAAATRICLQVVVLARSTYSTVPCSPAPRGPKITVGIPAAARSAASVQ